MLLTLNCIPEKFQTFFFSEIEAKSENGILIYGATNNINKVCLDSVHLNVAKFSNVSRTISFDFRPSPPPQTVSGIPLDGLYANKAVQNSLIQNSSIRFIGKQPYYGICLNSTTILTRNLRCSNTSN